MAEQRPDHAAQAVRLRAAKASLTQGAPLPTKPTIGPHSLRPSQLRALLDLVSLDASNHNLIASSTFTKCDEGILIGQLLNYS